MKYRKLLLEIGKYLDHKNIIVISGLRQVGKTTLLKQLYEKVGDKPKLWFDLDNPLDQIIFENIDYKGIYDEFTRLTGATNERLFVFIDEIQNYPPITKALKYLMDHFGVKFFVSGSSNYYLRNLFPESLSGRKFLFQLNPLNFKEFLYFKDKLDYASVTSYVFSEEYKNTSITAFKIFENEYLEYLEFGGFPEVVLTADNAMKTNVLRNIFASFFEKDLRLLSDYKDIKDLRDFILLLAPRVGSLLDITRLSSELGINRARLYDYLELLQGLFFIKLLPRYSKSVDRSVAGGKKIYFSDTGLLNLIARITQAQLLENAVVNQLSEYGSLSFYNYRNTAEIDIILDQRLAFEVKTTGSEADVKKLQKLSSKLGLEDYFVFSQNYRETEKIIYPHSL